MKWPWKKNQERLEDLKREVKNTNAAIKSAEDRIVKDLASMMEDVEDLQHRVMGDKFYGHDMTQEVGGLTKMAHDARWALIMLDKGFQAARRSIYGNKEEK
jgi:hypothetical protein